jgi:hypothetical protein
VELRPHHDRAHLRDLVVTEYGIADLHGARATRRSSKRPLAITDARFVDGLVGARQGRGQAARVVRGAGRLAAATRRKRWREKLAPFRQRGLFPTFPFGSDFDETELRSCPRSRSSRTRRLARAAASCARCSRGARGGHRNPRTAAALKRLGLDAPLPRRAHRSARLVAWALSPATAEAVIGAMLVADIAAPMRRAGSSGVVERRTSCRLGRPYNGAVFAASGAGHPRCPACASAVDRMGAMARGDHI